MKTTLMITALTLGLAGQALAFESEYDITRRQTGIDTTPGATAAMARPAGRIAFVSEYDLSRGLYEAVPASVDRSGPRSRFEVRSEYELTAGLPARGPASQGAAETRRNTHQATYESEFELNQRLAGFSAGSGTLGATIGGEGMRHAFRGEYDITRETL